MAELTGELFEIAHGDLRAGITTLGAALQRLSCRDTPIVWGFPVGALPRGSSGQVLAPWPNRLGDGAYRFDDIDCVAPLDEPQRQNAIHGLVRWLYWEIEYLERDRVKLRCNLAPQPGYPFRLSLSILYALSDRGLSIRVVAGTESPVVVPFGIGFHPYFLAARKGLAGSRVVVPATRHLLLDERGLPVGEEALAGGLAAIASEDGLALADAELDDCFANLERDGSGDALVRFFPGGADVEDVTLRLDRHFDYVMCYTGDTLAAEDRRLGVAIEPMTCAPDAFRNGQGLLSLRAASPLRAVFSIRPTMRDGR